MGFSLVGNSGDSTQTTKVQNYTSDLNPQLEGTSPGDFNVNLSPISQGPGGINLGSPQIDSYYAPIAITSTGDNLGDAALNALQSLAATNQQSVTPTPGTVATPASTTISSTTIYLLLGGVVLLFLAHE